MCVTCKIPLNVAQSQQANRERAFIQGLIDEGQTEAQIKRSLVAQYGPTVLALPSAHGFDLTVYLVPLAALLALLATLAMLLPRWRRHARDQDGPAVDARDSAPPTPPAWTPTWRGSTEAAIARIRPPTSPPARSPRAGPSSARSCAASPPQRDPQRLNRLGLGAEHAAVAVEGREVLGQLPAHRP